MNGGAVVASTHPLQTSQRCKGCNEPIVPHSRTWIVIGNASPGTTIVLRPSISDWPVHENESVFGSITCFKKWILDWVDANTRETRFGGNHGHC